MVYGLNCTWLFAAVVPGVVVLLAMVLSLQNDHYVTLFILIVQVISKQ